MKFSGLHAEADLIGPRVRLRWRWDLAAGETVNDVPRLALARKELDYEFPAGLIPDPFVIYDSGSFPPAGAVLQTVSSTDMPAASGRTTSTVESASVNGQEVSRRKLVVSTS